VRSRFVPFISAATITYPDLFASVSGGDDAGDSVSLDFRSLPLRFPSDEAILLTAASATSVGAHGYASRDTTGLLNTSLLVTDRSERRGSAVPIQPHSLPISLAHHPM
jgi:hypothetical protein